MRQRTPKPPQPAGRNYGLPPELAKTNHLGKQLAAKRKEEAKTGRKNVRLRPIALESQAAFAFSPKALPEEPLQKALSIDHWLENKHWRAFPFQCEAWEAIAQGKSGLLHATTGSGKTYAVWLGVVAKLLQSGGTSPGLKCLWITPMRALAADTVKTLAEPVAALDLPWTVVARTGDTAAAAKAKQTDQLPTVLVTTPESLSLLLARSNAAHLFGHLQCIVVDEWHELLGNKRGVQVQLALARLFGWQPGLQVWGLSATLGDLDAARAALTGRYAPSFTFVRGAAPKALHIDTLIPQAMERFPWGGHIGIKLVDQVIAEIESARSTIVFTNVRSQAEIWYQAILTKRPDWAGVIALHHGSLDREVREWVEAGLKAGALKAVVSTSSLDLGVDFSPVERVLQIGSPKGVARLMQRAGRSGHAPGQVSRITIVPTNALEVVEAAAARTAALAGRIEARTTPEKPLDVLVQHLVTVALGGGFVAAALFDEVRTAHAYRNLTRAEFDWAMAFVERGGTSLTAYPDYHRVQPDEHGVHRVPDAAIARRHRMSIGTIVAEASMHVAWMSGGRLGTIEEDFIARLKEGDSFTFGGRVLELVRVRDLTAYVKKSNRKTGIVPQWAGSKLSFSTEMAAASLDKLAQVHAARTGETFADPELNAVRPLLAIQQRWSALPRPDTLVLEVITSDEGHHLFCYPFAGRMAHIGLGSLIAWRAAHRQPGQPGTFSVAMNDYGFELFSAVPFNWVKLIREGLFSTDNLLADVITALSSSQLALKRFREIARVSGLVFQGFPGAPKSMKQTQASSSLFYEVFRKHDAGNLLLAQADFEALSQELELARLSAALEKIATQQIVIKRPPRFTPFAFPLMVARLREMVSTEKLSGRVARMVAELEAAADA